VRGHDGYSLMEVTFVAGFIATAAAMAIPQMLVGLDDLRTLGAVRYIAARLQQTRMEAIVRAADTALRFTATGGSVGYTVYVDGNRNGVRTRDIQRGLDREIQGQERLSDQFPGVDFGAAADLPAVEGGSRPPAGDPIRAGSSDMITFTPLGTSTPGSLYIRGRRSAQYAIRVFGETGKTRILKFNPRGRQWTPL